jgi:hypothetical protein
MIRPLVEYVEDLSPDLQDLLDGEGGREFLRDSMDNSVFVRQMQLGSELDELDSWETRPSNLSGIEEKTILPLLREHAPEDVMDFWSFKIEREKEAAAEEDLAVDAADFENIRLPSLLWSRAEDMRALGNPTGAYLEMLKIMQEYPNHPNYMGWAKALEGYITAPATAETGNTANPGG